MRKAVCKLRIGAHNLLIETGRYAKKGREQRIWRLCNLKTVENEFHFLTDCCLYDDERYDLFSNISIINNIFVFLCNIDKARWLLLEENQNSFGRLSLVLYSLLFSEEI